MALRSDPLDRLPPDRSYTRRRFPNLNIPPMTAGRTTQILILFVLYELEPQTAGEWEINVSIQPGAQTEYQHNLPPLRIAAVEQGWLPVVSGLNPKTTYDQIQSQPRTHLHELNHKQSQIPGQRLPRSSRRHVQRGHSQG